jgi:hypothetical protein
MTLLKKVAVLFMVLALGLAFTGCEEDEDNDVIITASVSDDNSSFSTVKYGHAFDGSGGAEMTFESSSSKLYGVDTDLYMGDGTDETVNSFYFNSSSQPEIADGIEGFYINISDVVDATGTYTASVYYFDGDGYVYTESGTESVVIESYGDEIEGYVDLSSSIKLVEYYDGYATTKFIYVESLSFKAKKGGTDEVTK